MPTARHRSTAQSLVVGAAAGFIATIPMTLAMKALKRRLPLHQRYPLPPRLITSNLLRKAHASNDVSESGHRALTGLAHFGYGTAVGSLFGPVAPRDPAASSIAGILYGIVVWATSYLGLLPSADLLPSARHHPRRRVALMIAAHVVWGATLGAAAAVLRPRSKKPAIEYRPGLSAAANRR